MRRHLACIALTLPLVWSSSAFAGLFGADEVPQGALCCIEKTCLLARSEADCEKVGGKVVADCQACEGDASETPSADH